MTGPDIRDAARQRGGESPNDPRPVVVIVNYHRIGPTDPANPLHRLHAVDRAIFIEQLEYLGQRGRIVSLEDVRLSRGLGPLNFALTFDDVPADALSGVSILEARDIPFTLSICGQLASTGWGIRDKVYCILRYLDAAEIERHARAHLPMVSGQREKISFYHLTKQPDLDPELVRAVLIEPLYARVAERAAPYLRHAYLSWNDIRDRFARHPLATLADHTWQHDNLAAYDRDRLDGEIRRSHHAFSRELGRAPAYFTVPFGRLTQDLALDLLTPLQRLGYRGVLWVGTHANKISGPYDAQIIQLTRLHAPATAAGFIDSVEQAMRHHLDRAIQQVRTMARRQPGTVIASSAARPVLNYEMLMRQGKDYASDPRFYRYQFTRNPAKGDRPDYYAMACQGRIEATAYNFHTSFHLGGHVVPGVYLASWRRLPEAHAAAGGLLVRRMVERECVVGVYKPNPAVTRAFHGWKTVPVYHHVLPVPGNVLAQDGNAGPCQVETFDQYDDALSELAEAATRRAGFTVARGDSYYSWRFDSYPLARGKYFALIRANHPVGFCVVLRKGGTVSIADFCVQSPETLVHLVRHVLASASSGKVTSATIETSQKTISHHLAAAFGGTSSVFQNHYHFSRPLLAERGIDVDIDQIWDKEEFHETEATGDVLLR
jgi:peptidoglycan/xylan/chitin deacetylase (PgdA/CDA1 family)